jgi:hypothetical protein
MSNPRTLGEEPRIDAGHDGDGQVRRSLGVTPVELLGEPGVRVEHRVEAAQGVLPNSVWA